jgi:hypothetical protein
MTAVRTITAPTPQASPRSTLRWAILLIGIALTPASAQTRPFSVHDTDRDGFLSRDEYRALLEMRRARHQQRHPSFAPQPAPAFDDIDHDRNGVLDVDELTGALQHRMRRHRQRGPRWRYPDSTR